jgi:hypothetical protein
MRKIFITIVLISIASVDLKMHIPDMIPAICLASMRSGDIQMGRIP